MKPVTTVITAGSAIAATALAIVSFANSVTNASTKLPDADRIERGRYIVHQVGLCIDCHSPRNEKGEFIESQHLTGSPLPFTPTVPMPWMPAAPRIAGLPAGFSEADTVHFLMTGERPNGRPPALPPMPPYRLSRADAEAVTAYLRTMGDSSR